MRRFDLSRVIEASEADSRSGRRTCSEVSPDPGAQVPSTGRSRPAAGPGRGPNLAPKAKGRQGRHTKVTLLLTRAPRGLLTGPFDAPPTCILLGGPEYLPWTLGPLGVT